MAFEPNYEKLVSSTRVKGGEQQSVIECKLPSDVKLKQVLCASAKAYITNSELVEANVSYTGWVSFQVVYTSETNEVLGMDYTAEFKDVIKLENSVGNAVPVVMAQVVDTNTMITGEDVKVVAIVETKVDLVVNNETNALVSCGGDNVFTKTRPITYSSFVGIASEKSDQEFDIELKDSVDKILTVCQSAYISKITTHANYLEVTGGLNVDVCYVTKGENPRLQTYASQIPFSMEVALDGLKETSFVQSNITVLTDDVKITTSLDENTAVVHAVVPLKYSGYVFNMSDTEIVEDLFTLTNYVNTTLTSIDTITALPSFDETSKLNGSVTLDDTAPFVDEMLGTCCNSVVIANTSVMDEKLLIEGVATTTVLYLNKELNTTNSVEVELPFALSYDIDATDYAVPNVLVSLGDVNAKVRRGKEIDVTAILYLYADLYSPENDSVISNVELQDEIPPVDCALSIYLAKDNDTIWDIAKELNVSPDKLLEQNPDLPLPIVAGSKIIIYRENPVQF